MSSIDELKAYHHLTGKALDIHRQWDDLELLALIPLAVELKDLGNAAIDSSGDGWARKADTKRHLAYLLTNLRNNKKELCKSDIDDLIYSDLPALGSHLLRMAEIQ
ncbi:hypothetical protein [Pseudomonas viridiflava]|uniref:hypothetical protein n=1 Tax=Pseudomonas viridiflava TaxID=33069 RepID=UPI000F016DE8|nr:hypothetical protein [Pseudomonas viridiflava]